MQFNNFNKFKISLFLVALSLSNIVVNAQQVIVSDDATYTTPASGAMLDVKSTNKGFLPPRIALSSTSDVTTVPSRTDGLLIYNTATASDITPGYYYWNGTVWERILNTANNNIQTGIVTKTTTATLSKSDNFVYASGDIDLTLPAITSADNGLTIFVKNVGTYMDHVVVKAPSGVTIDGYSDVHFTRNLSNTFIAKDGNWILQNQYNHYKFIVSNTGSFQTIAQAVEFMGAHMHEASVIELSTGVHDVTSNIVIDLDFPLTITAPSYGMTEVDIASGITGFTLKSTCFFKMIDFVGAGSTSTGIDINSNLASDFYEIKDSYFSNFGKGMTLSGLADIWLFETDFENCSTAGFEINSTEDTRFRASECDFLNCAIGVNLLKSGSNSIVSLLNDGFYNEASQTSINYARSDFQYSNIAIQNNTFNNVGTFTSGFDFSNSIDANIIVENNGGVPTEKAHANVTVTNNTLATPIAVAGTYYLAKFTISPTSTVTSNLTKFGLQSDAISQARITYLPKGKTDILMNISGNVEGVSTGQNISVAIVKNGITSTLYGNTTVRAQTTGQPYVFSSVVLIPLVTTNDYFEIYVTSAGSSLTLTDLNWFVQSL